MIRPAAFVGAIITRYSGKAMFLWPLGLTSREAYRTSCGNLDDHFYCLGSMGSVVPLALGLSMGAPKVPIVATEGDGSLLMNLGALHSLRRTCNRVALFVLANAQYESTGGQPTGADAETLAACARRLGHEVQEIAEAATLTDVLNCKISLLFGQMCIVHTSKAAASPRPHFAPVENAMRFAARIAEWHRSP